MPKRILIVEDEPDIALLLKMLLVAAGFVVLLAGDMAGARSALAQSPAFDLLVIDLVLPDGDGLVLCREAKAAQPARPVVVLTAQPAAREAALAAGADLFVTKPFDPERLESLVAQLVLASSA